MQLCMNMLDLTWDGTSKCFLRSSVIFIDILGFPRTFFPRTFSPCVFSQVSFFTSTSHNETVINKKVSQNWAKYSSRHIQIACCFSTSYDLIQKWSCRVFVVVVVISWFLSSKMRFFFSLLPGQGGHSYLKEWLWWAGLLSSKSHLFPQLQVNKKLTVKTFLLTEESEKLGNQFL